MAVELLTSVSREAYLDRITGAIENAERFALVTAFATVEGLELLEPSMRRCLERGGSGTLVLARDRQHFNAADVFAKLAELLRAFGGRFCVYLVPESDGLLHAKALFAQEADGGGVLIVGSANLTRGAFDRNHELGLFVDLLQHAQLARAFVRFVDGVGARALTAEKADEHAAALRGRPRVPAPREGEAALPAALPPPPTLPPPRSGGVIEASEPFIARWLRAGHIVGRGRRALDALVIRMPGEQLEQRGLIERAARTRIGAATEKTTSSGYGLRLLPDSEDERLRGDARRMQNLLAKLTLNLPCFGLWMPATYWDVFQEVLVQSRSTWISADEVRAAAARRREELAGAGIDGEVEAIVADLAREGQARPGKEQELRRELLAHFDRELARRTPELVARAVGFRTQRQSLGSSEVDLRIVARSFFVDVVQATLSATYRTGSWPRRFRSSVARALAAGIAQQYQRAGRDPTDDLAIHVLDLSTRWEDERLGFDQVCDEVQRILGEPGDLICPGADELIAAAEHDEGDGDGLG
jgi:HKD family nuclease